MKVLLKEADDGTRSPCTRWICQCMRLSGTRRTDYALCSKIVPFVGCSFLLPWPDPCGDRHCGTLLGRKSNVHSPLLAQGWIFENKKRRLIAQGKYVYAEILGFPLDSFLSGKEHPVYQMLCSYKDPATGKEYLFHDGGIALSPDGRVANRLFIHVASCISVQNEDS